MDLLYQRYANPFSFLSKVSLRYGFSQTILKIWNEVQEDKIFRMYLHSFSDKSFNEYREELLNSSEDKEEIVISDEAKEDIVRKSNDILQNFTPFERREN